MSKIRLIVLSMLAVFAASALAATSAAARGCEEVVSEKCLWTLEGKLLGGGESRELKPIRNSTFTLKGKALTTEISIVSNLIALKEAKIIGAIPGTDSGTIIFKNVEVIKPKECQVNQKEVKTEPLASELVELVKSGSPQKVDDVLVKPETGNVFVPLKFENLGIGTCEFNGLNVNVEGTLLAEPIPRGKETKLETLKAQGKEAWEYRTKNSTTNVKSKLVLLKEAATLEGTVELGLVGGGSFGTD